MSTSKNYDRRSSRKHADRLSVHGSGKCKVKPDEEVATLTGYEYLLHAASV